ncbi:H-NS histone family protein [Defluviimonas aestuarii]|uniref:H-NS histone family protein n=1 Tax=Albidovulum aestuarii TaxID=1130726 RepID=UPI00249A3DEB|nr:H-NS histone family protein [Defluviimonas aestuarii]MDI3337490.1 H-NS histone family protein [Defluviimonas aestuarii]
MKIDLTSMSLKDLKDLQKQVARQIEGFEERKKREALAVIEEKAKALGFSLNELVGVTTVRKRKPAKPKYANPANKSETWTGRGRKPRWVEAALKAGKKLDDLAI